MTEARRTFGLDVLRAVAIVMVLANHGFLVFFLWTGHAQWQGANAALSTISVLAIEWLFALSGFLIGAMLIRGLESSPLRDGLRSFWIRRWLRTLPNYYLFLLVNILLLGMGIQQAHYSPAYAFFTQNLVHAMPAPVFFGESWTLALDEWFYAVWPLAVAALLLARLPRRSAFTAATLLLILVPTVARLATAPAPNPADWDARIRTVTLYHLDGTGWGVLAAVLGRWAPSWWERGVGAKAVVGGALTLLGLAMLEAFTFAPDLVHAWPRLWTALPLTLTGAGAFLALPAVARIPSPRPALVAVVRWLSDTSYSIYLSHLPLALLLLHALPAGQRTPPMLAVQVVVWLAFTFAVSTATYHGFEKPIARLRERYTRKVDANPFQPDHGHPNPQ